MKALSAFLLAPLVLAFAGDMLNRVASNMRCAPVDLGHWLINKREAQRSCDMVSCRQEAGPFVLSTKLGLQETALERLAGPSAPCSATPHTEFDLTPRISHRAERRWCMRLSPSTSPAPSVSVFVLKTDSKSLIGPNLPLSKP